MVGKARKRRVIIREAAAADLERLGQDDPRLPLRARAYLNLIEDGAIDGEPLKVMAKHGDLSDCRKVYFSAVGQAATHRIVYRHVEDASAAEDTVEVVEVVAVESRQDAYVYLLTSSRLGRLPGDTERELNTVHQETIARRASVKKNPGGRTR